MDWNNLIADENRILTKHFTSGRSGAKINKVILHHNGGNLSIAGCYNVWQTRAASAHYQVDSNGRIGQLVHDKDTAWHAGNWNANITSIGIEHADISSNPWRISDACLESGAHLTAAVCKAYGLGRPEFGKNVFGHKQFSATACPASLMGNQQSAYMSRAQAWYDAMVNGTSAPNTSTGNTSNSTTTTTQKNFGDRAWTGPKVVKEWQRQLGCSDVDGKISGQTTYNANKVQWAITVSPAENWKSGSIMVKKLQTFLNNKGYNVGSDGADGHMGHNTVKALQRYLNDKNGANIDVDGYYGNNTSKAVCAALDKNLFK